ncbi:hypothetical protein [Cytobacillus firmus]|nr:hypothetical protein [Cytobacillus firmus]MCS0673261.1 hypothetical protein [Cytobacillus firmus]
MKTTTVGMPEVCDKKLAAAELKMIKRLYRSQKITRLLQKN